MREPKRTAFPYTTLFRSELHQLRQIGLREIMGAHPRVELFEPEVNRIRAIFDCGPRALPIPGGREQFGKSEHGRKPERIGDRKSTRLNSSHITISYAGFG